MINLLIPNRNLTFSRPGRPPKRFLPPQFSSTPPLNIANNAASANLAQLPTTPTAPPKPPKLHYDGKQTIFTSHFVMLNDPIG